MVIWNDSFLINIFQFVNYWIVNGFILYSFIYLAVQKCNILSIYMDCGYVHPYHNTTRTDCHACSCHNSWSKRVQPFLRIYIFVCLNCSFLFEFQIKVESLLFFFSFLLMVHESKIDKFVNIMNKIHVSTFVFHFLKTFFVFIKPNRFVCVSHKILTNAIEKSALVPIAHQLYGIWHK